MDTGTSTVMCNAFTSVGDGEPSPVQGSQQHWTNFFTAIIYPYYILENWVRQGLYLHFTDERSEARNCLARYHSVSNLFHL